MQAEIARHPYFGPVTSQAWKLVFHPPDGRPDVAYVARFIHAPTSEDYARLVPRLAAFEAFCRRLDANDRLMQDHFRSWAPSAGTFELVGVVIDGDEHRLRESWDNVRVHIPDWPIPLHGLMLQYRALNAEAWEFAGIHRSPPVFSAFFDEAAGTFSGIEEVVETGMRTLPETITRSRFKDASYRHPYFGRRKLQAGSFGASISRLGTAMVAGRKVPIELYMNRRALSDFEPEQLDAFVPLAQRLAALDAMVKVKFPAKQRADWLAQRFSAENLMRLRRALDGTFPGVMRAEQVTPESFAAALTLRRACFSLCPEDSGGAALTLDYHLLPIRLDNELFAARFAADGTLMEIVVES